VIADDENEDWDALALALRQHTRGANEYWYWKGKPELEAGAAREVRRDWRGERRQAGERRRSIGAEGLTGGARAVPSSVKLTNPVSNAASHQRWDTTGVMVKAREGANSRNSASPSSH
jgi:hypothetical protein